MGRDEVWRAGEDLAASYLAGLGWRILARNWRCPAGELDIIAVEPGPPARYRLLAPRGVLGGTTELTPPAALTPRRTR